MWSKVEMDDSARLPAYMSLHYGSVLSMPDLADELKDASEAGGVVDIDAAVTIADMLADASRWPDTWQRRVLRRLADGEKSYRLDVLQAIHARRCEATPKQEIDLRLLAVLEGFVLSH
ncbi:hypothetical protein [Nocardioides albus]|uniref:Uncharacterized protein n=1 Tax=Nocardioides albus TaxID=1841 RepID=A0A7W5A2L7_9ACTN|nr:hypothetical protein [Nocardioides albus]MBB3088547.1 hypothetical protein [Nocardioides albus]GGU17056.1 hypothetical protein GCM10007979_14370 [Nocardioides albus]